MCALNVVKGMILFMLNDKENKKYETIEKVVNGFMTRKTLIIKTR